MRRLTRSEIEDGGKAMPRIMAFHDQLIGQRLQSVAQRRGSPPMLVFDQGTVLATQFDDEGNPGETEWEIVDPEGYLIPRVRLRSLIGKPVTGFGYFHDTDNSERRVIPYIEIEKTCLICCLTAHGGGVIFHHRENPDRFDLFCQFKPKPTS